MPNVENDLYLRHWAVYFHRKNWKRHVAEAYALSIKEHEPPPNICDDVRNIQGWKRYLNLAVLRFSKRSAGIDKMMNYGRAYGPDKGH